MNFKEQTDEVIKGCKNSFMYRNNELGAIQLYCGTWENISPTHSKMEWCTNCLSKMKTMIQLGEFFNNQLEYYDDTSTIFEETQESIKRLKKCVNCTKEES